MRVCVLDDLHTLLLNSISEPAARAPGLWFDSLTIRCFNQILHIHFSSWYDTTFLASSSFAARMGFYTGPARRRKEAPCSGWHFLLGKLSCSLLGVTSATLSLRARGTVKGATVTTHVRSHCCTWSSKDIPPCLQDRTCWDVTGPPQPGCLWNGIYVQPFLRPQEGFPTWGFVWQRAGRSPLSDVPNWPGHCTLKKEGSRASRMAPVFQYAFRAFLMVTTFWEPLHLRIYSLCRTMFYKYKCPVVSWLRQVDPGMARWVWPLRLPASHTLEGGAWMLGTC